MSVDQVRTIIERNTNPGLYCGSEYGDVYNHCAPSASPKCLEQTVNGTLVSRAQMCGSTDPQVCGGGNFCTGVAATYNAWPSDNYIYWPTSIPYQGFTDGSRGVNGEDAVAQSCSHTSRGFTVVPVPFNYMEPVPNNAQPPDGWVVSDGACKHWEGTDVG